MRTKYTPPPTFLGFSKRKPPPCLRPVFHVRTGAVSGLDTVQPRQTEQISGIRYVVDPRDVVSGCEVYLVVSFAVSRFTNGNYGKNGQIRPLAWTTA